MQDRRLEQDDNLGLGQGVNDNQPTLNIFKLALENIAPCQKRSQSYPAGFLTPSTHHEYNRLLHPVEKLVWHENDWVGVLPSYGEERDSLPIGYDIAALRDLRHVKTPAGKKGSRPTGTIGLVINRKYLEECDEFDHPTTDTVSATDERILQFQL